MNNKLWLAALLLPAMLPAQDVPLDFFTALAPKAAEKVEVSLNSSLLQMAAKLLGDGDADEVKLKSLLAGLKGIYVRSLKFKNPGEYAQADVDRIRGQLRSWNEIVNVHNAKENTGVYLKTDGQKIQGLVVVAAEPLELTVVNIEGEINP